MITTADLARVLTIHANRDIGRTGIRRVTIDVLTQKALTVTYVVDHIWERDGPTCRSLMHLTQPAALAGTSVLISERVRAFETRIWLKLSTARRPIVVAAERVLQHVLGTDFSYEDLRFWYPTDELIAGGVEQLERENNGSMIIRARRTLPDGTTATCVLRLRYDGALLEMHSEVCEIPGSNRALRATKWQEQEGRSYPTQMTLERMGGYYVSNMYLMSIRFDVNVPQDLFDVDRLLTMSPASYRELLRGPVSG
jgi:hypothetical protein